LYFANSFGIYAESVAAGVITEEEGEELIVLRSDIVKEDEKLRVAEGKEPTLMAILVGRAAVHIPDLIGRRGDIYQQIVTHWPHNREPELWHSNDYSESLGVVTGERSFIEKAVDVIGPKLVRPLRAIEGGYHIEARRKASERYAEAIDRSGIQFKDPDYPMIASTNPRPMILEKRRLLKCGDQLHYPVLLN
jgi:hypothetical protein